MTAIHATLEILMTNSITPPCGVCIQSQTNKQEDRREGGFHPATYFTSQHLLHPIPAWISQLALAKWQRLCDAAGAKMHAGYTDGVDRRRSRQIESWKGKKGGGNMRTEAGSRCLSHLPYCCYTLVGILSIIQQKQRFDYICFRGGH